MANKEDVVISYLLNKADYVKVDTIINDCSISRRSFYNYLKDIKNDNQYIVDSNDKGIKLSYKNTKLSRKRPEDYEGRKTFLLRKGLIRGEKLHVPYLLDYFAISDSTLHNDIIRLRREISKFHVRLINKGDELIFSGNYHDLKKLTQHIIYSESNNSHSLLSVDRLQEIFPDLDVNFINNSIRYVLSNLNYFMDEYSIINLCLHILISLNQEVNGVLPISDSELDKASDEINKICAPIEKKYNFKFSNNAKNQFSMILSTRVKSDDNHLNDDFNNIETSSLSKEIFDSLMTNYNLDMNDSTLKYSFMLHLDSLITRIKNNVNLNNPLLATIKQSSPITYDVAVTVAGIIKKNMHFTISESEIAYIALHIGTRIEELKSIRNKLNVIIVSPEYYNYNSGLKKIAQLYSEDLYISNVYTSYDGLAVSNDVDLIICTFVSYFNSDCRVLKISSFLTSEDRNNINNIIQEIKKQKNIIKSKKTIYSLFKRDLFFASKEFNTKAEAIEFLSDNLYKNGYVSKDYKQSINKREEIAPTDFNMIAIPHPAEYSANETVISVCLLNKALNWGRNEVSIIMMISVSNKDFETFDDIFTSITQLAIEPEKLKLLAKQGDYDEFIKTFLRMLYE